MPSDDDSASSAEEKDRKERKAAKKAKKKQKKAKKTKKQRLTAHAALDLTPAGEPAPAPAPVAETLDDRMRLLAARGASDAEIGKMLREAAGAATPSASFAATSASIVADAIFPRGPVTDRFSRSAKKTN